MKLTKPYRTDSKIMYIDSPFFKKGDIVGFKIKEDFIMFIIESVEDQKYTVKPLEPTKNLEFNLGTELYILGSLIGEEE